MPFSLSNQLDLRVAIYIRVSTHYQVDKDSLKVQRRDLEAYCRLMLKTENFIVFEDPGFSAKNTDRPEYQKMMRRIRTGEFSHLLVWKLDRISRNLLDFSSMYEELKDLGVTFISLNEQFDTSTAMGEAMLKIILVFAELERKMTAERVTAVMVSRAQVGKWNGGKVPYGYFYNKESKQFSVNLEEKALYERVLDMYEDMQSLISVVRWLNDNGFRTRSGNTWSAPTVHKLLSNPWYTGVYLYAKGGISGKAVNPDDLIVTPNHHEAMISEERFDRIQLMLKRNGRGTQQRTYERKHVHLLAGLLRCGKCGSGMTASLDKRLVSGWRPSIYGCSRRRKDSSCSNKYVSDKAIGPFVFNIIGNILKFRDFVSSETTITDLERALLSGEVFGCVSSVGEDGLTSLLDMLKHGESGIEYIPPSSVASEAELSQADSLRDRKRKLETAEKRLSAVFLYSEDSIPEAEYISKKQKIAAELEEIEGKLSEFTGESDDFDKTDYRFLEQASYFVMVRQLLDARYIDYEKYIRVIDPTVAKSFLRNVVHEIEIDDGQIMKMVFVNGLVLQFNYK